MQEIAAVCDYIIVISEGEIVANDTPEGLVNSYADKVSVSLKVKGSKEESEEVIKNAEGILKISYEENKSTEFSVFCLEIDENQNTDNVCENLFFAFSKADIPINEMKVNRMGLEDIFIKLTSKKYEPEAYDSAELGQQEEEE